MNLIIEYKPLLSELYHHGVLGMKWGVRKDKDRVGEYGGRIKAGTKFTRMSMVKQELNEGSGFFYKPGSMFKEVEKEYSDDIEGYIGAKIAVNKRRDLEERLAKFKNKNKEEYDKAVKEMKDFDFWDTMDTAPVFRQTLTTKVDLILPSMKEKGEIFVNDFFKDKNKRNMVIQKYNEHQLDAGWEDYEVEEEARSNKDIFSKFNKELKTLKPGQEVTSLSTFNDAYTVFTVAVNDKNVRTEYGRILAKKGYNAVTDDLDNGVNEEIESDKLKNRLSIAINSERNQMLSKISKLAFAKTKSFLIPTEQNKEQRQQAKEALDLAKEKISKYTEQYNRTDLKNDFQGGSFIIFDRQNLQIESIRKKRRSDT